MNYLAFDLELNQPSRKVIQVGYSVVSYPESKILESGGCYVNPEEELDPRIIKLTGIKQKDVEIGSTLQFAHGMLDEIHTKYACFKNLLEWGPGDTHHMQKELGIDGETFVGGRHGFNVKALFIGWRISNGRPIQSGLARAMTKLGLRFEGRQHDAIDDATNTGRIFVALLDKFNKGLEKL